MYGTLCGVGRTNIFVTKRGIYPCGRFYGNEDYNYGAFDFSTPNFIGRFIKGDLQYFVTNGSFIDFYYNYQAENREIIEQELDLKPSQINTLFQQLNQSVYSEDRFYTYKFIDRNCTTMVVDKINGILVQDFEVTPFFVLLILFYLV